MSLHQLTIHIMEEGIVRQECCELVYQPNPRIIAGNWILVWKRQMKLSRVKVVLSSDGFLGLWFPQPEKERGSVNIDTFCAKLVED